MNKNKAKSVMFIAIGFILGLLGPTFNFKYETINLDIPIFKILGLVLIIIGLIKLYKLTNSKEFQIGIIILSIGVCLEVVGQFIVSFAIDIPFIDKNQYLFDYIKTLEKTDRWYGVNIVRLIQDYMRSYFIIFTLIMVPLFIIPAFYFVVGKKLSILTNNNALQEKVVKNTEFVGMFSFIKNIIILILGILFYFIMTSMLKNMEHLMFEYGTIISYKELFMDNLPNIIVLSVFAFFILGLLITHLVNLIKFIVCLFKLNKDILNTTNEENTNNESNSTDLEDIEF